VVNFTPGIQWIRRWVGFGSDVNAVEEKKSLSYPCRESKPCRTARKA